MKEVQKASEIYYHPLQSPPKSSQKLFQGRHQIKSKQEDTLQKTFTLPLVILSFLGGLQEASWSACLWLKDSLKIGSTIDIGNSNLLRDGIFHEPRRAVFHFRLM